MSDHDHATAAWHRPLHHVPAGDLDPDTEQTPGMRRFEALSARHGGTRRIWMGEAVVVLARSTQEGILVKLPSLWAEVEVPDEPARPPGP